MKTHIKTLHGLAILGICFFISIFFITSASKQLDSISSLISSFTQTAAIFGAGSGLVGHWSFDEGNVAESVSGISTTLNGSPNPTFVGTAKVGANSISFNGAGFINVSNPSALNFGTGDFTVSFWVKSSGTTFNGNIYPPETYLSSVGNTDFIFYVSPSGTRIYTGETSFLGNDILTDNNWHHVVVNRNNGVMNLYIDTSYDTQSSVANNINFSSGVYFGVAYDGSSYKAIGQLDDVRFYNRSLDSTDIMALYTLGGGDQTLPGVSLAVPSNGASVVGTSITLSASASDNINIGGVQFKVDGTNIGSEVTSPSSGSVYSTTWNTSSVANGLHTLSAVARDTSNNLTTSSITITVANDLTPPVISSGLPTGVLAANTTQTILQVTTDKAATCKYGTTANTSYDNLSNTFSITGDTTHTSTLSGLANNTSYNYYVRCEVTSLNPNTTDKVISFSVSADTIAPVISLINASGVNQTSATINWSTDEAATTQVEYGPTVSYGITTTSNSNYTTYHTQALSSLTANSIYHYRVLSRDSSGNLNTSTDQTLSTGIVSANSNNIYIAQNAVGADNGSSCATAHSVVWFNTSTNWGSATGKIGPGDTVHLCGTVSSSLIFQNSGSAGNPITLYFEQNAKISAPIMEFVNWLRAGIYTANNSYIIIDGGVNGIIESTQNGTTLANQVSQNGIIMWCSECEVKNLKIQSMYTRTPLSGDMGSASGIYANGSHLKIHDNTLIDCGNCIQANFDGGGYSQDWEIYNNNISRTSVGINLGPTNANGWLDGLRIYANDISDTFVWAGFDSSTNDPWASHHHNNGMHIFANSSGSKITNVSIYDNYIHGDWGINGNATSFLFIELNSNSNNVLIYNNLLVLNDGGAPANAYISVGGAGSKVFNNTIIGKNGLASCINAQYSYNNICHDVGWGTYVSNYDYNGPANQFVQSVVKGTIIDSDYNLYYVPGGYIRMGNQIIGEGLQNWQNLTGFDTHSQTVDPQFAGLSSNNFPASGSSVVGKGKNLSSYFTTDIDGNSRPSTGPWTIGAYEYTGSVTTTYTTGDFNRDGLVNSIDLSLLVSYWNQNNATHDLNNDNTVNSLDYGILVQNWSI